MKLGMRSDERHASIKVALPANRCERVRDVIDALVILEDVYNHLYASWFPDHQTCGERAHDKSQQLGRRGEFSNAPVAVPEEDRLCLAQIEIDPPAFVEIVGATEILQVIYNYWQRDELQKIGRKFSMLWSDSITLAELGCMRKMKPGRSVKARNREKQFKITLYLSQQAKENLEKLRLKLLDKQGRKPADSQIVEGLLRAAFKNEVETPYPVKGRPK